MLTYPSIANVQAADLDCLDYWDRMLPPPQTDVERTVRRRITTRIQAIASEPLRAKAADPVGKLEAIIRKLRAEIEAPKC